MFFKMITVGAFAAASLSWAGEAVFTPFEAATPATAESVNAAFTALVDAINDNNARIAQLEQGGGSSSPASLEGSQFKVEQIGLFFEEKSGTNGSSPALVANMTQSYTFNFGVGGTFSASGTESEGELFVSNGSESNVGKVSINADEDPVSFSGTYSLSGNTITISLGGDTLKATLGAGGNVLLINDFGWSQVRSESSFLVGVRL